MKYKLLTATISILCVLLMMAMTFQPVAATRGSQGMTAFPDMIIDENGDHHMVYSQMLRTNVNNEHHGMASWQFDVFYKNDVGINQPWFRHHWNTPIRISSSDTDSVRPQIAIDVTTGIIYVAWIETEWHNNEFWYAGSLDGLTFTQPRFGANAPWPTAPRLDMSADSGSMYLTWRHNGGLTLVADIDGDLIPDIDDAEPTIYNVDNPSIDMDVDVVSTDNALGVTVAVDYIGEDNTVPTVSAGTGDLDISTGDYIDIDLDTTTEFNAMIKMPYTEVPQSLTEKNLRMYRQVGDDWVVVTDWENDEFTGINEEDGYVWAYVEHFSTYTAADASLSDGDTDGLTDLTEDTEPPTYNTTISVSADAFTQKNNISGVPPTISYLEFSVQENNDFLATSGLIEITSSSTDPINDLELDIGDDGTTDWKATVPFEGKLRIGSIREAMNKYMFDNNLNSDASIVSIPFKFISSTAGTFDISFARIVVEDITTANALSDSSSDDLYDGWQDKNGNFIYERAGVDGITGTADDEIPGARCHNLDPRNENIIGSKGNVPWNEYRDGINQVNGNLAVSNTDLQFKALGNQIELTRTYNSLNSGVNGPFGYGWQFSYGEKLEFKDSFVYFISGDGAYYEFEDLDDGNYSAPAGTSMDLIETSTMYKLRYTDGSVKEFDTSGRLLKILDKNDNALSMIYDSNNQLIKVQDDAGLFLNFYYADNLITQIEDPAGRINTYAYDASGNLRIRTDSMDNVYRYSYNIFSSDFVHKLISTVNPLGLYKEYTYTDNYIPKISRCIVGEYNFIKNEYTPYYTEYKADYTYPGHTNAVDANQHSTKRIFDKHGVATKIINPDNTSSVIKYGNYLRPTAIIDSRGNTWHTRYDAVGNQIEKTDPRGNSTSTIYRTEDTSDRYISVPEEMTDKNGETASLDIDSNYNPINFTDRDGYITTYKYTGEGFLTSQTSPNDAVTTYEYDIYGNVINEIDPMGNMVSSSYDEINQKISETDARGFTTQYTYDALGRKTQTTDPLGNIESYTYDAAGNMLSITNIAGSTITYTYDLLNRKTSETDSLGNTTFFKYDQSGNIIEIVDKRGASTNYYYDEMNRLIQVKDALGYSEYYSYDEAGNKIQTIDKLGNYWNTTYDELGRVIGEYCPYNKAIRYEYDAEGRMIKQTDRMGYETIYEYDARGNQIRILGAEGSDTRYQYDEVRNLVVVSQIDGSVESTWEYDYDLLGRKTGDRSPLGFESHWVYDEVGNVIEYIDAHGSNTSYKYDALNRLTNLTLPGEVEINITYQITENERQGYDYPPQYQIYVWPPRPALPTPPRLSMMDKEFDALGRLTKETWIFVDGNTTSQDYVITYEYDEMGNVIKMVDQLGLETTYTYDALNRLETLTDPDNDTTSYIYDALGQLTETTYPTGTKIYQEYNKANLLTEIENVKSTGEVISSFAYTYNYNAQRTSVTEANGDTIYYSYDKENRLTGVQYPDYYYITGIQYRYDNRNNMVSKTMLSSDAPTGNATVMEYDIENRLTRSGDTNYTYDNNGNMIVGNTYYGYQSTFLNGQKVNMLASVGTVGGWNPGTYSVGGGPETLNGNPPASPGGDTPATTYAYALDGRRVSKAGAVDVEFLYDGDNVIYELRNDTTVRFTHPISKSGTGGCGAGHSGIFTDHPISISIDGVKYYYLYDGLGSVTELIDEYENVVNQYRYTPFGSPLIRNETVYNPYQFTGRRYDNESGQYYYRARMYSPDIGRFLQADPAGMVDGANMYAYVGNDPVVRVDPGGMGSCWWSWTYWLCKAIIGAILWVLRPQLWLGIVLCPMFAATIIGVLVCIVAVFILVSIGLWVSSDYMCKKAVNCR